MYGAEVDQLIASHPADLISALAALPEGQWFERKSGRIKPRDLAKVEVAMANAEGGCIVIGVHDGRFDPATAPQINDLRQAAIEFTRPPVRARLEQIDLDQEDAHGSLLIVRVDPGDHVHELDNGDAFLRVGDESKRLGFTLRQELEFDRGAAPFDGTPVSAILADVDTAPARAYQEQLGSSSVPDMLAARGLTGLNGELTVAAYLLFADHPQRKYPHALVRVLRYHDIERGSGRGQNLDDASDIRCEGSIPQQIEQAREVIARLVPTRRALGDQGRFAGHPIIPEDAWLEGLVNAVIHRSYSAAGDHIRVEIFPNRIEISSPGRFPGLGNPDSPLEIRRYARNPRIARVCADLGFAQELGEGIRRIFDEMQSRGLVDPIYTQTQTSVRLVLSATDAIPQALRDELAPGALRLLDTIRPVGRPLGTGQIEELSGLTRPTVIRHLNALREAGLVRWEGQSSRDPRAVWEVL
ncbi:ATP-binding protein [Nocardioides sp.]|uniref:ATP-binding protein n=1 Tax=Nocardioides sp. TaxID=35761 RepID=UPI00260C8B1F|nr:ATP-binding protein [Nocardioides sp.]